MTKSVHVSPCECVSVNLRVRLFMCAHVSECSKVRVCANVRVRKAVYVQPLQDSSVTPTLRSAARQYLALLQSEPCRAGKVGPCVGMTKWAITICFINAQIKAIKSFFLLLHANHCRCQNVKGQKSGIVL